MATWHYHHPHNFIEFMTKINNLAMNYFIRVDVYVSAGSKLQQVLR